jgi:hypothetical protein
MIKREAKKEAPIEKEKEKVKEEISPKEEEVKEEKKIEERVKSHEPVIKEEKIEKPKSKPRKKTVHKKDFADKVLDHVNKKEMQVIKNFEDDGNKICIAQMESKVGALKFLVFGMDKKALSESDLSFAFSEGQQERLPVLLVTSGKLTKKAEEYLKKLGDYVVINKV